MNSYSEKFRIISRRMFWIIIFNIFAFSIIIGRLYYLQVYEADKYRTMSDENRISTRFLVPPRGIIYDRNGGGDYRIKSCISVIADIQHSLKGAQGGEQK